MNLFIFLWNFQHGGVQKHAVLLANELVKNGVSITILYSKKEGSLLNSLDGRVELVKCYIPNTNNLLKLIHLRNRLKECIPIGSNILCNGPNNFRQLSRLNKMGKRWNLYYILHNDLSFSDTVIGKLNLLEMRMLCHSKMTQIIALSKKQKMVHQRRLRFNDLKVIPNFIDFHHAHIALFNKKAPRGVSLGRYAYQKGYDILLESMSMLGRDKRIDIYGFGEEERMSLINKARENKTTNIEFHKSITSVYEVLSKYDYFILSSRFEPFGIVVAEALSCGLPVLATDCDGPLDIITEENGIIVKRNDPESLAKGIEEMVEKVKQGFFDADTIRKSAEKYSVEKVAKQYLERLK